MPVVSKLDRSSHEVLVFDPPQSNAIRSRTRADEPRYVHYLSADDKAGNEWKLFIWMLRNIWRFDVVHVHTHVDRHFASYMLASVAGCKVIYSSTLEDSVDDLVATYTPFLRPLARRLLSAGYAFVAISPRLFSGHDAATSGRALLIPQGVAIQPKPEQEQAFGTAQKISFGE